MPIYEYFCQSCASKFELLRPMSRIDEDAVCPQGHHGGLRQVSRVAAINVRSDFYDFSDQDEAFDAARESDDFGGGGSCACGSGGCGNC